MKTYPLTQVLLFYLTSILLGGCIDVSLKVNVNPDLSADFVENIVLDAAITNQFSKKDKLLEGDDFWSRFRKLADDRGWNLQEKASNYLQLNGHYKPGTLTDLGGMLGDQFASGSLDLGAKPLASQKKGSKLLSSNYVLSSQDRFFTRTYHIEYDLDLSYKNLQQRVQIPEEWGLVLTRQYSNSPKILVSIKAPFKVLETNGSYDAPAGTISWRLRVGENNKLQATFEVIDWSKIAIVAGALLAVLIAMVLFFVFRSSRSRKQADETPPTQ